MRDVIERQGLRDPRRNPLTLAGTAWHKHRIEIAMEFACPRQLRGDNSYWRRR
jgi:hypothetical protein